VSEELVDLYDKVKLLEKQSVDMFLPEYQKK